MAGMRGPQNTMGRTGASFHSDRAAVCAEANNVPNVYALTMPRAIHATMWEHAEPISVTGAATTNDAGTTCRSEAGGHASALRALSSVRIACTVDHDRCCLPRRTFDGVPGAGAGTGRSGRRAEPR